MNVPVAPALMPPGTVPGYDPNWGMPSPGYDLGTVLLGGGLLVAGAVILILSGGVAAPLSGYIGYAGVAALAGGVVVIGGGLGQDPYL
jgi:hypothetical protein